MKDKVKDSDAHVDVVERECEFLRQEIERSKYSKDKNEYKSFISGLSMLRRNGKKGGDKENERSPAKREPEIVRRSPIKREPEIVRRSPVKPMN